MNTLFITKYAIYNLWCLTSVFSASWCHLKILTGNFWKLFTQISFSIFLFLKKQIDEPYCGRSCHSSFCCSSWSWIGCGPCQSPCWGCGVRWRRDSGETLLEMESLSLEIQGGRRMSRQMTLNDEEEWRSCWQMRKILLCFLSWPSFFCSGTRSWPVFHWVPGRLQARVFLVCTDTCCSDTPSLAPPADQPWM